MQIRVRLSLHVPQRFKMRLKFFSLSLTPSRFHSSSASISFLKMLLFSAFNMKIIRIVWKILSTIYMAERERERETSHSN